MKAGHRQTTWRVMENRHLQIIQKELQKRR
ncbi:hypothetical protein IMSAGC018_00144 [Lachnospiraceae bacterium]|nr:hypothetical protein IMSAGC018_00144 [Lachnospiraceae bacterium]